MQVHVCMYVCIQCMHINIYVFNEVIPVSDNIPSKNYELSNKYLISKHEGLPFELLVRKATETLTG